MALLLLLFAMMATTSDVFADDYTFKLSCNGVSYGRTKYCQVNGIGEFDVAYYELELIRDYSNGGCKRGYYDLVRRNNKGAVRVFVECNGYFGIKPKNKGYPYKGRCGQNNFGGFKIVNGYYANTCRIPWMAFVKLDWRQGYRTSCGGSIVNDRWILTAAHCVIRQHGDGTIPPLSGMYVRTGSLEKSANYIQRELSWIVPHPEYDRVSLKNDIAVLKVKEHIKWDGCHAPVCLNTDRNIDTDLSCIVSGWGNIAPNGPRSEKLKWAYDRLLSRDQCDKIYRSYSNDKTICGRATSGNNGGFCSADSGGPLVCKSRQNNRYYQHGIVSAYIGSRPCTLEGLYTSVAGHYNWIRRYIDR